MKVLGATQFSSDSVFQLQQPYLWNQTISVDGSDVSSTVAVPAGGVPDTTDMLFIEVPDGQAIRYEVNPPGRPGGSVTAGNNSPRLSGFNTLKFGAGWLISMIDAAGLP